ncbi:MAG: PaaI family thioesterase [Gammaproteobacteria bacterium]|nr:PaaI family thioesterase [Gammaproteobacteria bacterium]
MPDFQPTNPDYAQAVRGSFAKQGIMRHIGATLVDIQPGYAVIQLPYGDDVSQQHGFFHGGVVGTIADSAGGYAGFSLMAAGDGVLTVEYKINLVAPADGELLIARGQVIRPGRTLTATRADVLVVKNGRETLCGMMQQTLMRIVGRAEVTG